MILCLAALLISVSASLCCITLWMQTNSCHSCCTPSGEVPAARCEAPRLDVDRAEHMDFAVDLAVLAAPVAGVAASAPELPLGYTPVRSIDRTQSGSLVTVLRI
jgi:hypothetical protein